MNIHEYQAKGLLRRYGVPVPQGYLAATEAEALAAVQDLSGPRWVVKAQIHAGGRGKNGGVRVCRSREEAVAAAASMLGMRLVTPQTGPAGKVVYRVWIERGVDVVRELYAAVVLDRGAGCLSLVMSPDGGMDIETVAVAHPERVARVFLGSDHVMWDFQARDALYSCGLGSEDMIRQGVALLRGLVRLCREKDMLQAEINPLAVTAMGELVALDAKLIFDDSALPRHFDIAAMQDRDEQDMLEERAAEAGINYIRLHGSIASMVNGAGLAMATMDAIKQAGGEPANFLDVGGEATVEMIVEGLEILFADSSVQGIVINIFGGILRCDVVARGIIMTLNQHDVKLPVVIRMEGTNKERARAILIRSGLEFTWVQDVREAAEAVMRLVREADI